MKATTMPISVFPRKTMTRHPDARRQPRHADDRRDDDGELCQIRQR
jgi:hypothetical protein